MTRILGFLVVASLSLGGCTTRMGDLTVASTRLASLDRVDLDALPTKRRVRGQDLKWIALIVPIGVPHLEDAVEAALDAGGGDVLTDATIHRVSWWFFVGQTGFRVIGDVVDTRQRPPETSP